MARPSARAGRVLTVLATALLAACASSGGSGSRGDASSGGTRFTDDPYPSTYRPIAAPPTLIL